MSRSPKRSNLFNDFNEGYKRSVSLAHPREQKKRYLATIVGWYITEDLGTNHHVTHYILRIDAFKRINKKDEQTWWFVSRRYNDFLSIRDIMPAPSVVEEEFPSRALLSNHYTQSFIIERARTLQRWLRSRMMVLFKKKKPYPPQFEIFLTQEWIKTPSEYVVRTPWEADEEKAHRIRKILSDHFLQTHGPKLEAMTKKYESKPSEEAKDEIVHELRTTVATVEKERDCLLKEKKSARGEIERIMSENAKLRKKIAMLEGADGSRNKRMHLRILTCAIAGGIALWRSGGLLVRRN